MRNTLVVIGLMFLGGLCFGAAIWFLSEKWWAVVLWLGYAWVYEPVTYWRKETA